MATDWIKVQCEINFGLNTEVFGICRLLESVHEDMCSYDQEKKKKKAVDLVSFTTII